MSAFAQPNRAVFVIGEAVAAQQRAHQLRMRGHATWVVTVESDLRWLLEQACVRATCAVVEVAPARISRRVEEFASLAAAAGVPCLLVGATEQERSLFPNVTALLPPEAAVESIVEALPLARAA